MDRYGRSVSAYPILQGGDFSYEQQQSFHRVKQWLLNQDDYVACPPPDEPSVHAYYYKRENYYVDANIPSRYCSDSQLNHCIGSGVTDNSNFRKLEARRYNSPNLTRRRPNGSRESNINKIYASTPDALDKIDAFGEDSEVLNKCADNYASKINTFPRRHKTEKQHQPIPNSLLQQEHQQKVEQQKQQQLPIDMGQQLEKYQPFSCSENVLQSVHHGTNSSEKKPKTESKYKMRLLRPKSWSEVKSSVFNYGQIEGNYYKHKDINENMSNNLPDVAVTASKALDKHVDTSFKKRPISHEALHIRMRSAPETQDQPAKSFHEEYRKRVPSLIRKVKAFSWPKRAIIQSYSTVSLTKDPDHPLNKTESGYNTEKSEEKCENSDEKDISKSPLSDKSSEVSDTPPARPPFPQPQSLKKTLSNRKSSLNISGSVQQDSAGRLQDHTTVSESITNVDVTEKDDVIECSIESPLESVSYANDIMRNCVESSNSNEKNSAQSFSNRFEDIEINDMSSMKETSFDVKMRRSTTDSAYLKNSENFTTDESFIFSSLSDNAAKIDDEPNCKINIQVKSNKSDSHVDESETDTMDQVSFDDAYDVIDIDDNRQLLEKWSSVNDVKTVAMVTTDDVGDNRNEKQSIEANILHCKSASEDATLSLSQEKDCSDLSRNASISLRDLIRIHEQEIARVSGRAKIDYSITDSKRKSCIIETKPKPETSSHWKRHTTIGLVSEPDVCELNIVPNNEQPIESNENIYQENRHSRINSSLSSIEVELRSPRSYASSINWPKTPPATAQITPNTRDMSLPSLQADSFEIYEKTFSPKSFSSMKSLNDAYIQTDDADYIDGETLHRREENYRHEIAFYEEQIMFLTSENEQLKDDFKIERSEMRRKLDEQRKVANAYQKLEDRYRRKVYELQKKLHQCTCVKNSKRNLVPGDDGWSSRTLSPYSHSDGGTHEISVEKVSGILHQLEAWLNNQTNAAMATDTSEVSSLFESVCDDHTYARYRLVDHYASPPLEIIEQINATSV